ncbi:MAG TPA: hypothetical protein VF681_11160 [Abditibacteriaceae bacterium]|jgi:hypothetical protein
MTTDNEDDNPSQEEAHAIRWRRAILRLSEAFMDAADERQDLSPILLEALHNALDNLLFYGESGDLMVLEEWLSMEEESKTAAWREERRKRDRERRSHDRRFADRRFQDRRTENAAIDNEQRCAQRRQEDRRAIDRRNADRRDADRRSPHEWQFEEIKTGIVDL